MSTSTSPITTHVLDTAAGRPAAGVDAVLERQGDGGAWSVVGKGQTDADGRIRALLAPGELARGQYRLTFDVAAYFAARGVAAAFYRRIPIEFVVQDPAQHHHVPLLLSPFGYSTYRGS
jgi:5-hydroxyisourate hydrolase